MKVDGVLSLCATCKHAEWRKTANGRRHPDGSGRCAYEFPDGPIPKWVITNVWRSVQPSSIRELCEGAGRRYIWRVERTETPTPCATWEAQ
jgi:hypothetical protein